MRRQSEHLEVYRSTIAQLIVQELVYPSFESRSEIAALVAERERERPWPRDPDGVPLYPGTARSLSKPARTRRIEAGEPYALRLDMTAALARVGALTWSETGAGSARQPDTIAADPSAWGDVVLARKETPTSYHLAVVVDDALQGVTHVVRGQDLFAATAVHRLLQALLGLPQPAYHHHRLILDAEGRKVSKSSRSTGLQELRAQGATPADVRRLVGLG